MNLKTSVFFSLVTTILTPLAHADLSFSDTLVARSHITNGYELPAMSFLNNTYPQISNHGDIAFKVNAVDGTGVQGIWYKPAGQAGKFVHIANEGYFLTEPFFNQKNQIAFSNTDELNTDGVYLYDSTSDSTSLYFDAKKAEYSFISHAMVLSDGTLYFRGTTKSGERSLISYKNELENVLSEGPSSLGFPISYVFLQAVSDNGLIAIKVRIGEVGETGNNRPDALLLLKKIDGKYEIIDRVDDSKGNPQSIFDSLGNGVKVTSDGAMSFIAYMGSPQKKAIVVHKNGQSQVIAKDGEGGISQIESFTPATNTQGLTVFRALDKKGLSSIFVHYKGQLQRYIGEGDTIMTDLGMQSILHQDGHTGLHGAPAVNDHNEFVFATTLEDVKLNDETGNAVFKVQVKD